MKTITLFGLAFLVLILTASLGCREGMHIGMDLLTFEIRRDGVKIHEFLDDIRDDSNMSQKWELILKQDLPGKLAKADSKGGATLSGAVEIRMLHAHSTISQANLCDIQLEAGSAADTWKIRAIEMPRIKKAVVHK